GLLELYETTLEPKYLKIALDLNQDLVEHFWDNEQGGFFFTANDSEELLVRQKEIYDGATPSGNSIAAMNLIKLSRITGSIELNSLALNLGKAFSTIVKQFPSAYTQFLLFVDFLIGPSFEVVVVGPKGSAETQNILNCLNASYTPNKVVVFKPCENEDSEIISMAPYTKNFGLVKQRPTAYVCGNYTCQSPTNDPEIMLSYLKIN
ncbi:MAG: thioredoxin domain-containing protein, partial [Desulfomonilaceae bacterium]